MDIMESPTNNIRTKMQLLGELPDHLNILIVLLSTIDIYCKLSPVTSLPFYGHQDQLSIASAEMLLNSRTKMENWDYDVIIIKSSSNFNSSNYINLTLAILDLLGNEKIPSLIIVEWLSTRLQLYNTLQRWKGIRNFGLNSHLYFAVFVSPFGFKSNISLVEAYCVVKKKIISRVKLLLEQEHGGEVESSIRRRKDFKNQELIISHVKRWNIRTSNGRQTVRSNNQTTSPTYQYLAYMQDMLNFGIQTESAETWFKADSSGHWTGMMKSVLSGRADLGLSSTGIGNELAKDVHFLIPPTLTEEVYVSYLSTESNIEWSENMYEKSFKRDAWICIASFIICFFLCRILFTTKIQNSFWFVLACITQKEWSNQERNPVTSLRSLTLTTCGFCYILYILFSSQLISSLATRKPSIQSIDNLIEKGFQFGMRNNSAFIIYSNNKTYKPGQNTQFQDIRNVFARLHPTMGYLPVGGKLIQALKTPKYGFLESNSMYIWIKDYWAIDKICREFKTLPVPGYSILFSPIVRKNSSYQQHFNVARLRMKETGITAFHDHNNVRYSKIMKPECPPVDPKKAFELKDVSFLFYVIRAGFVLCGCIFIVEIILKRGLPFHEISSLGMVFNFNGIVMRRVK